MNKPAPKEPSMDEILSSIRQIIADDDAGRLPEPGPVAATPEPPAAATPPATAAPEATTPRPIPPAAAPLSLSAAQIVPEPPRPVVAPLVVAASSPSPVRGEPADAEARAFDRDLAEDVPRADASPADDEGPIGFEEVQLVEADDVTFEADAEVVSETPEPEPPPEPAYAPPPPPVRPAAPVGRAAPLPDPTLSSDMAEQLLGPATEAAVRHTFNRLGPMSIGAPGVTVESMIREMLRPMLKEWLDEHLPSVVERMVEREIARISRGLD